MYYSSSIIEHGDGLKINLLYWEINKYFANVF